MPVFDQMDRTDTSPALHSEPRFQFINRSARPEFQNIRRQIEAWVAAYPASEQHELIRRFQSGSNSQFNSAEFELLLFSALTSAGFSLFPHPQLENGSSARPDFLCRDAEGEEFYLEAVLASENSEDRTSDPLIATTLDVFAQASHPNFLLIIATDGYPITQPNRSRLLRDTLAWLDTLDPDLISQQIGAGEDPLATFAWTHEALTVTLKPWPIAPERRGTSRSLTGVQFGRAGWVDSWSPIRDAVKRKGSKYGALDKPFLVAVNFLGHHLNPIDEKQALYGQEVISYAIDHPELEPTLTLQRNGAWMGNQGPQFTRVSGAWLFNNVHTFNVHVARPNLYPHPWAAKPLPNSMLGYTHRVLMDERLAFVRGKDFGSSLALPASWPQ